MKHNQTLYKAYLLKEQMLSIFDEKQSSIKRIKLRIFQWFQNIVCNQMEEFYSVKKTTTKYFYGIINYFRYGMTNAIAEGYNTKINIIKRRAYGFKDTNYFILKIYQSSMKRIN